MTASELMARMGEHVASATRGDVLVALGLGSCIGLALIDRRMSVCGLAHVVLPSGAPRPGEGPGKWVARTGIRWSLSCSQTAASLREPTSSATGGSKGRTVKVHVDGGRVGVREAGAIETTLWPRGRA